MMMMTTARLMSSVVVLLVVSTATGCSCVPGSTELSNSLDNTGNSAASINVGVELTPQPHDINAPRYWDAEVVDRYQGCGVGPTKAKIVVRTGGNSALCGTDLTPNTQYLLVGGVSQQTISELSYTGAVLSFNSCTFHKPWAELTKSELYTLNALGAPKCDDVVPVPPKINCTTCPNGYFDGCNSCFCRPDGIAGCSKKFCAPGTFEHKAKCNSPKPTPPPTKAPTKTLTTKCCDPYQKPGFGTNPPGCKEGFACCPDGTWSCSIGDGKSFPCGGVIITTGFSKQCDVPIVCTDDVLECPDGSLVSRDPTNDCKFDECDSTVFCTADVKTCPDGSFVSRNPKLGCAFSPCPLDCNQCPFGYFDGCNTCSCDQDGGRAFCTLRACGPDPIEQPKCNTKPDPIVCTADAKLCLDGSSVGRDPNNNCEFMPCPPPTCDICPFGFFDGCNNCGCGDKGSPAFCTLKFCDPTQLVEPKCNPKPDPIVCTADAKLCLDGSSVGRDPNNNCDFMPCPPPSCKVCPFGFNDGCNDCQCDKDGNESCTERACLVMGEPFCLKEPIGCQKDAFVCPDGSSVSRDPNNNCEFPKCPLPKGCYDLDGCFLLDLSKTPATEQAIKSGDKYPLVSRKSQYSIRCNVAGKIGSVTFFYPNGDKSSHVEWVAPWHMRGESSNGRINRVPYLNQGCGKKKFTVEGKTSKNVCFSTTLELEATC